MNEERLEALLAVYRHKGSMPALPRRSTPRYWWLAAAAAVIVAVIALWPRERYGWLITEGSRRRTVRTGETIATAGSMVRMESREIGTVDIAERTTVRVLGPHRFALDAGTIHAKTTSPPGLFTVDTPRARAVDLGCEYVLSISPNDGGTLRVSLGWVALNNWAQTLVPQGARAEISADGRLTAPFFEDASPAFQEAVRRYSFGRTEDLQTILTLARRRDALTLINLFRFATVDERLQIYDRLNALVPAPASVSREAVRDWTFRTTDPWWPEALKASGVNAIKKKKRMLPPL